MCVYLYVGALWHYNRVILHNKVWVLSASRDDYAVSIEVQDSWRWKPTTDSSGTLPVYDVLEQLQPVVDAVDGLSYGATLKPEVVFVVPLRVKSAAVARATPLPLGARGGWRGAGPGDEGQEVQNLPAVHGLRRAVALVDANDEVQLAVALLLVAVGQPRLWRRKGECQRCKEHKTPVWHEGKRVACSCKWLTVWKGERGGGWGTLLGGGNALTALGLDFVATGVWLLPPAVPASGGAEDMDAADEEATWTEAEGRTEKSILNNWGENLNPWWNTNFWFLFASNRWILYHSL